MGIDVGELLKCALTEYVKSHNQYSGLILEFTNKLSDVMKTFYQLPQNIQSDIGKKIIELMIANGVLHYPLR